MFAFSALGPAGAPAIPELIQRLGNPNRAPAYFMLQMIGKPALPDLVATLTNRANPVYQRAGAAVAIGSMHTNALPALDAMIASLEAEPDVAAMAGNQLGFMGAEPDRVVPPLIEALKNGTWYVRSGVLYALANFGTNARPALPSVTIRLTDEDLAVRTAATNALKAIKGEEHSGNQ